MEILDALKQALESKGFIPYKEYYKQKLAVLDVHDENRKVIIDMINSFDDRYQFYYIKDAHAFHFHISIKKFHAFNILWYADAVIFEIIIGENKTRIPYKCIYRLPVVSMQLSKHGFDAIDLVFQQMCNELVTDLLNKK